MTGRLLSLLRRLFPTLTALLHASRAIRAAHRAVREERAAREAAEARAARLEKELWELRKRVGGVRQVDGQPVPGSLCWEEVDGG